MKTRLGKLILLNILFSTLAYCVKVTQVSRIFVGSTKQAIIAVDFDDSIRADPDPSKYALIHRGGEKVYCTKVVRLEKRLRFIFQINSANFVVFERLVSDSSGYALLNEEPILFGSGTLDAGELAALTQNRIRKIEKDKWDGYVLDEYSVHYLIPQQFKVGTRLGVEDTTKTMYYLELAQTGRWVNSPGLALFWGLKGRWSTERNDKFNYVQFYPLVLQRDLGTWRVAGLLGVETGNKGFGRLGRASFLFESQFRLPVNPIDFTFGNPRFRINPAVTLSAQGNLGWGDHRLPDSLKRSFDGALEIRYDIPVAKTYYLQTNARGFYSSVTKEFQYQYEFSLGYVIDGSIRVLAAYRQGFQKVTYEFDRQLLLGIALDALNEVVGR